MEIHETDIPDLKILQPRRVTDVRGYFSESYSARVLRTAGIDVHFVQDNESLSKEKGVVRGLHYQIAPAAQAKLIRVVCGAILDVAVDIRRGSPTFGQHVSLELSAADGRQLFIPPGFAHGFVTLESNTLLSYKVSDYYSPAHDRGIRWNDPAMQIRWPIDPQEAILSERDRRHPLLADAVDLF
jgi:dTDP-4-dehydrorhamnose 3,5-epimerase